ncbi:MAG: class D beta-lactamase [Chloroflexota bacterium]
MKRAILSLLFLFVISSCQTPEKENWIEEEDFATHFAELDVDGTFVLFDQAQETYFVHDSQRANTGFIPASTYKIFNSLVALETNQIADADEVIQWDGVERGIAVWNQDHNLRSAIQNSVVWFYQELARGIGAEQMSDYLERAEYGNQDLTGKIDSFWLDGKLRITPKEQVGFLRRLYHDDLPFSQRSMDIVKDILVFEEGEQYIMRAKTGWGQRFEPQVGWFVGYVEQNDNVYFFATNIDIVHPADAGKRIILTKTILRTQGLL